MKKKILASALALTIVGTGVAGATLNTSAFAAKTESNSNVEVSDEQDQLLLEKEATITKEESISIALKEVSGKVTDVELEDEDGTIVYGVEIVDAQGIEHDVKVDAKTGKVLKVEADDEEETEGAEENDGEVSDKAEQEQLAKLAKISQEEGISIALQEVKGNVTDVELEDEDGTIVYGVEIVDAEGLKHDVKVDAKTGKVVKVDLDDETDDEVENDAK